MEIKDLLRELPFIRPSMIEKELGIPHGTIRLNSTRPIPEKYQAMIIESLDRYSAIKTHVVEKVPEIVFKPELKPAGKQCIVKRVYKLGIGEHAYIFGKMEGGIFKRDNDIPDGTTVIIG
jgi:hypothetical protein